MPTTNDVARVIFSNDCGLPPQEGGNLPIYPAAFIFPTKMMLFWIRTPGRNRTPDLDPVRGLTLSTELLHSACRGGPLRGMAAGFSAHYHSRVHPCVHE